jgi:hypothetical protein
MAAKNAVALGAPPKGKDDANQFYQISHQAGRGSKPAALNIDKALKGAYEPGRKDATKTPARFGQVLNITIVVLEVLSSLTKTKHT